MPRTARQKSSSGIYHIMMRGANRQEIFHDDEDSCRFLDTLERYKKEIEIRIFGWCLMGNHVHLLLQEGKEELAVTMKRIGVSYAWFYNWKYKTTGHLFQDRYKSEKVEDDSYLIAVVRYIHHNPVKACIVQKPSEWEWSSCQGYYNNGCYPAGLLERDLILDIFSDDKNIALKKFKEFNEAEDKYEYLDNDVKSRLTDEEVREEIRKIVDFHEIANIKSLPKSQRDEIVCRLKNVDGPTQRQLSRILGISLSLINRA